MARRTPVKNKIRVGISINHAKDLPSVLWSNGMTQNAVYLALLLKSLPNVEAAFVAYPFGDMPLHPAGCAFDIPTINVLEDAMALDVLIEVGIRLELDFAGPFRDRGGKLVSYMAGNSMVMNFESLFMTDASRGSVASKVGFDAVWITPQHWRMNQAAAEMLSGPAFEAPHIWSDVSIQHAKSSLGLEPGWKGRPETWSLGCFDPNINVVKSFHFPLLVAEAAYRAENKDAIRRMMLFCSEHLKGRAHFESFIMNTQIGKANKVTSEARHGVVSMLGREVDAVITHQWENDLNYLFWDVLFLGYPLIHNSPRIREAGYYYPSFDPYSGGDALLAALETHDGPTEADKQAVWRHHIGNPANQTAYAELLEKVLDSH